jgi:hypothetical protein
MLNKKRMTEKQSFKDKYGIDFPVFFALVGMMTQDSLRIDIRNHRKATLLKLISSLALFLGLTFVFKFFFQFAMSLNLFSILPFVPLSVPSLFSSIVFVFGFFSVLHEVTTTLYFAPDLKTLAAYPANGLTLFLARLFTVFIKQYLNALLVEIPFLFGYLLNSGLPFALLFQLLFTWGIYIAFELLIATFLSIPLFYLRRFFRKHRITGTLFFSVLLIALIASFAYLLSFFPEKIDIFTNWGPYFAQIQKVLTYYTDHFRFFYGMTQLSLGSVEGYSFSFFGGESLFSLLILLASSLILFLLDVFFINPLYLSLATKNENLLKETSARKKEPYLSYPRAQIRKELLLFGQNTGFFSSFFLPLIILPVLILLLSKIFGAMSTDSLGDILVNCVMLLLILLTLLSSVSGLASLYSEEGKAYVLARTFPVEEVYLLGSKLLFPAILILASGLATVLIFGLIQGLSALSVLFLFFTVSLFGLGHLFFTAGLDIEGEKTDFGNEEKEHFRSLLVTVSSFVLSFVMAALYFLFLRENADPIPEMKTCVFSMIYFTFHLVLFRRKAKYLYREGESV